MSWLQRYESRRDAFSEVTLLGVTPGKEELRIEFDTIRAGGVGYMKRPADLGSEDMYVSAGMIDLMVPGYGGVSFRNPELSGSALKVRHTILAGEVVYSIS